MQRPLGKSGLEVSAVAMGCWPIAGITSINVNEADSRNTIRAAFEAGITHFDTAFCYGYHGESERMLGECLRDVRDCVTIATKAGIQWRCDPAGNADGMKQVRCGEPQQILTDCDVSLRRLSTDVIDLYYLHAPDPQVPVGRSAEAFERLRNAGKIRAVGLSNATRAQLEEFHRVCRLDAFQPHYNMLQREIEDDGTLAWCRDHEVAVMVYWPLMKGLLAGKLQRDHCFDPRDGRRKYPMFHGEEWERNQDFLDELRALAAELDRTVAEVVINWTIHRVGITSALCGAKRPDQIRESAAAMRWQMTPEQTERINAAIARRGPIVSKSAV